VHTKEGRYFTAYLFSFINRDLRGPLKIWGIEQKVDNRKSVDVLGVQYRSNEESILQMVESMIDLGLLEDRKKKD
jgi:hypothetical protein